MAAVTSPEMQLAQEFAAQTLGTQTLYKHRAEISDHLRGAMKKREDKVKKAILKAYLLTPVEKRGQLDLESTIEKFTDQISKKQPWEEDRHPRDAFGRFIDKLGLEHPAIKRHVPLVAIKDDPTAQRVQNGMAYKIVHMVGSREIPASADIKESIDVGAKFTRQEALDKANSWNAAQVAQRQKQLTREGPEAYLKQVRNIDRPAGGVRSRVKMSTDGEPIGYERGRDAVISDFLGIIGLPGSTEPGKPVHNLGANIRSLSSRGFGEAHESGLKEWMDSKTWGGKAVKAGAFLSGVFDKNGVSARTKAFTDFADAYGDEVGKHITRYYYRYTGISRPGGPEVQRGKDARGREIDDSNDKAFRKRLYAALQNRLPDNNSAQLSRASGSIPPSEGFIIAGHGGKVPIRDGKAVKYVEAKGQVLHQSLGRANDHYLPYNMSQLTGLKGGGWSVRRRQWGGPTVEDLHIGLLTGASGVGVVSRHGIYEVEFSDLMKNTKNRMGAEHVRMINRYEQLLDAIKRGDVENENGQAVRLNHHGYTLALEALKSEFPWYIKHVEHQSAAPDVLRTKSGRPLWSQDHIADNTNEEDFGFARRVHEFSDSLAGRVRLAGRQIPQSQRGPASTNLPVVQRAEETLRNAGQKASEGAHSIADEVRQEVASLGGHHESSSYGSGWGSVSAVDDEEGFDSLMTLFAHKNGMEKDEFIREMGRNPDLLNSFEEEMLKHDDKQGRDGETDWESDPARQAENERRLADSEDQQRREAIGALDTMRNFEDNSVGKVEDAIRTFQDRQHTLGAPAREEYQALHRRFVEMMRESNKDYEAP